jgi:virginiamycin B lyase
MGLVLAALARTPRQGAIAASRILGAGERQLRQPASSSGSTSGAASLADLLSGQRRRLAATLPGDTPGSDDGDRRRVLMGISCRAFIAAVSVACLSAATAVGAVLAAEADHAAVFKRIIGTDRANVLLGTAQADFIDGRAGNDVLRGLGGNDRLIGGAGADRIFCGRGRDTVSADRRDTVARDCEVVTPTPTLPAAGRIIARIPLPGDPQHLAFGAGSLWATTFDAATPELLRVDAATNAVVARIPLVRGPTAVRWLGFGEGSVWVSNFDQNSVSRIDPATNTVVATIPVTLNPTGIGFGAGSVWVTNHRAGTISRIDPATNRVVAEISVGPPGTAGPQLIAAAAGAIWVTVPNAMALVRVDPGSNAVVARIADGPTCASLAEGFDSVWGDASCDTNTLVRVNVGSHGVTRVRLPSNERVHSVTTGFDSVWVTSHEQRLLRIDPATDRVAAELRFEGTARGARVVVGESSLWVGRPAAVVRVAPLP